MDPNKDGEHDKDKETDPNKDREHEKDKETEEHTDPIRIHWRFDIWSIIEITSCLLYIDIHAFHLSYK